VKDEKETTAALIAINEMVLHDLGQAINRAPKDLMQLVEQFDSLSLTGGLLAQMARTVRFMEDEYIAMGMKGIGQDQLDDVKKSLDDMRRKLELFKENAQESVEDI